jgi:hypothetical protein
MRFFQRLPCTWLIILGIICTGIATGTPTHRINAAVYTRWGFALHDFVDGTWYSLFTSVFFTNRPLMFWGILPFVGFSVGVYEWLSGPWRTAWFFWLTDLGGTLSITLLVVLPLYLTGTSMGRELAFGDDVGMSGGGFGCLGGWISRLPRLWQAVLFGIGVVYLVVRLVWFTELFADLVHLLTFIGGYWHEKMFYNGGVEQFGGIVL